MQRTPPPSGQPPQNPGINLAPGGAPTDIFRPPTQPPSTSPQSQVPPQSKSGQNASAGTQSASASASAPSLSAVDNGTPVLLDFDPAFLTIGVGQQQTVLVRATSPGGFPGGTLRVRFDPSVAAAVSVRPVLAGGNGTAAGSIAGSEVVLELPDSADLSGTRAVAEITFRGIAAGRGAITFEPVEMAGAEVTFSTAVVDVR